MIERGGVILTTLTQLVVCNVALESYSAIETPVCLMVAPLRTEGRFIRSSSRAHRRRHRSLSNAGAVSFCPCIQLLAHVTDRWIAVWPEILAGARSKPVIRSRGRSLPTINICVLRDSPAHVVAPTNRSRRKGAGRRRRRIRVRA